ncbi:tetratricopeptide repeat protein [Runella sp.]|uniref:tetratricopeptide repeat protein n=1 Tax=Runella sp. TaxID=1960881 RepID=UPI0030176E8D
MDTQVRGITLITILILLFTFPLSAQSELDKGIQAAAQIIELSKRTGDLIGEWKKRRDERRAAKQQNQQPTQNNNPSQPQAELRTTVTVYDPSINERVISNTNAMAWVAQAKEEPDLTKRVEILNEALKADFSLLDAYEIRAEALIGLANYLQAIKDYDKCINIRPRDPDFYNNRGYAKLQAGLYQESIEDFGMSLAYKSSAPNYVYNNRGWAYALLGEYQNAIEDLNNALKLDPNTPNAFYRKGWCLMKGGNNKDALSVFDQIILQNPKSEEVWLAKGQANSALNRHQEAISAFDQVLRLNRQNLDALYESASSHYALGKVERAVEDCNLIVATDPESPEVYNSRGYFKMYLSKPLYADAINDFNKSLELGINAKQYVYTNRGEAYAKLGKYKEAQTDFRQALLLAPSHQLAKEGLDRVEKILNPNAGDKPSVSEAPNFLNRYALVIGNSAYQHTTPLAGNPTNDADDMTKILGDLGFKVTTIKDATKNQLEQKVSSFMAEARNADVVAVFYAGHGIEASGTNYLIPVDARLMKPEDAETEATSLDALLDRMKTTRSKINLVFLDACRNNPFRNWQAAGRATDAVEAARARAFIVPQNLSENIGVYYATKAKEVAGNGSGRNGNFTYSIKQNLRRGISLDDFWRGTVKTVKDITRGQQTPFVYGSIEEKLIF